MSKKYGFFSRKHYNHSPFGYVDSEGRPGVEHRSNFYNTPSGVVVEVTVVLGDPDGDGYRWDDKVFVGEVTDWVRSGLVRDFQISEYDNQIYIG